MLLAIGGSRVLLLVVTGVNPTDSIAICVVRQGKKIDVEEDTVVAQPPRRIAKYVDWVDILF